LVDNRCSYYYFCLYAYEEEASVLTCLFTDNVPPAFDVSNQAPTQTAISAQPIEEPSEPVNDGAEE
jgi:hypothetical protein